MDKINFENYPATTTVLSAEKLNEMQDNIENAINSIGVLWTESKTPATKITAGVWQDVNSEDYVVSLKKGTYRMLVSCTTVGDGAGIATIRPMIDGLETNTAIRQTINAKPPLLTSVQVERYFTVTEEKDCAFNAQLYTEVALTVSSVVINIHKIA